MKECKFRKIKCDQGHYSGVYPLDSALPTKCPICNQPYERKYNRPILCYEDGSVPEDTAVETRQDSVEEVKKTEMPIQVQPSENTEETVGFTMRRGRREETLVPEIIISKERNVSDAEEHESRRKVSYEAEKTQVRVDKTAYKMGKYVLYSGIEKIEIPAEGGFLGREGIGADILGVNRLISKRHARISFDRGVMYISDEKSLNGTYVDDGNGRRRIGNDKVVLSCGSKIWLANQIFVVDEG